VAVEPGLGDEDLDRPVVHGPIVPRATSRSAPGPAAALMWPAV
jgi:hypothetical protein